MLYCFGYWVVRFLYFLFYHIQVEGREHIPTSGGFVLASNHRSYADPPLLATRLRGQRCVFMAKEEQIFWLADPEAGGVPGDPGCR